MKRIQKVLSNFVNALFDYLCRKRFNNKDITILCSNCIGGLIYHRLGLQFLSPTVNLFMHQYNFIKFIREPKKYLESELEFIETDRSYPVAKLSDILVYFVHSKTNEEAADSWNRRKKRINWNNVYIIMYDRDGITEDDVVALGQIEYAKNVIMLSDRKKYSNYTYVKYIKNKHPQRKDSMVFLDKDYFKMRTFEKKWDFVKFLNK